ncbi:MAG: hypothetical protein OQK25_02320 [Gammaproteobacteria bacterium]|nr:hypothetical protein [Gammaproteobacteria bacterium]MCW8983547.1 hypothetical protein [Gammaproteobacteria bacterium]
MSSTTKRPIAIWLISIIAIIFGGMTIKSGGLVLFTDGEFHQQQGNYVPFVVWFNFSAGFAYITAGIGLLLMKRWATYLAYLIAASTAVVFVLFGLHVMNGGLYEMQTVAAMTIRTTLWAIISLVAYFKIIRISSDSIITD